MKKELKLVAHKNIFAFERIDKIDLNIGSPLFDDAWSNLNTNDFNQMRISLGNQVFKPFLIHRLRPSGLQPSEI